MNEAIELEYEHFLPYLHVAPDLADRVEHFHKDVSEVTEKLKTEVWQFVHIQKVCKWILFLQITVSFTVVIGYISKMLLTKNTFI